MKGLWVYLAIALGLWAAITALDWAVSEAYSAPVFPTHYDKPIRQAAQRWWPGLPWRLLKAQLWQESRLDPAARSHAGAEGLAQFMPRTAAEIFPLLGYGALDRRMAEPSIQAAAYYMATLRKSWPYDDLARHWLAAASYNYGIGNMRKAAKTCPGPSWEAVSPCTPAETQIYIERIGRWWAAMEAGA